MKKLILITLILTLIPAAGGCGRFNDSAIVSSPEHTESAAASAMTKEDFIVKTREFLVLFGKQLTTEQAETRIAEEPAAFKKTSKKSDNNAKAIEYQEEYSFWTYTVATRNIGALTEVIETKFRYYDNRTGLPYQKPLDNFSPEDISAIAYLERLQVITGYNPEVSHYAAYYRAYYHEKVEAENWLGDIFNVQLFPGKTSSIEYYPYWDVNITIVSRNYVYNSQSKTGSGYMAVIDTDRGSNYVRADIALEITNGIIQSVADVFWQNTKPLVKISVAQSGEVSTLYYIGKNFPYTSLSYVIQTKDSTGRGYLEDNVILEIQDSQTYTDKILLDGSKHRTIADRMQNITIRAKTGESPTHHYPNSKPFVIEHVDGVTVYGINFPNHNYISTNDCTDVNITY